MAINKLDFLAGYSLFYESARYRADFLAEIENNLLFPLSPYFFEIVSRISNTYKNKTGRGRKSVLCKLVRAGYRLRTFYEDYLKCIKFCEWLKEKAERQ